MAKAKITDIKITLQQKNDEVVIVTGRVDDSADNDRLNFYAAAPPDYRQSFSGSGLPYSSPDQAFYGTPNIGSVRINAGGEFGIRFVYPNSYYVGLGSLVVPPSLHVWYLKDGVEVRNSIKICDGIPFRSLTYPSLPTRPRQNPLFYAPKKPDDVRSQEKILRDSGYPFSIHASMPENFWGGKPPM